MTAQGSPATRFRRAVERRRLINADLAAREMGRVSLEQALQLVVLYAEQDDPFAWASIDLLGTAEDAGHHGFTLDRGRPMRVRIVSVLLVAVVGLVLPLVGRAARAREPGRPGLSTKHPRADNLRSVIPVNGGAT